MAKVSEDPLFCGKTVPAYLAPKLHSLKAMDKKIPVLMKCAQRAARVAGPYALARLGRDSLRFRTLWAARNRRTRVLMARAEREVRA